MRNFYQILFIVILLTACNNISKKNNKKPDLNILLSYMEGSFSSEEQAEQDTNYFHITLDMKRIWNERTDGAWLYVEQTAAKTPDKPYRQRVYHLEQKNDTTFTSTIYSIPNPEKYIGGHLKSELFDSLSLDSLTLLKGCGLTLYYIDNIFTGKTEEGACENSWGDATYATSEVTIFPDVLFSWDRGWNDAKEQVWGAEKGGYKFVKK